MGNCLKSQLKEIVQNDALPRMGFLKLKITIPEGFNSYTDSKILVDSPSSAAILSVPSNKQIYAYNNTTGEKGNALGSSITSKWGWYCLADAGEYYLEISKYTLSNIIVGGLYQLNLPDLSFSPLTNINFVAKFTAGSISNLPNSLTSITIMGGIVERGFSIKTSEMKRFSSMTNAIIRYYILSGDIKEIGYMPEISTMDFNTNPITGNLEDFVKAQVSLGKTTKSVTIANLPNSVYFNNTAITPSMGSALSWEPSGTAGKTSVTFGGVTVEIDN